MDRAAALRRCLRLDGLMFVDTERAAAMWLPIGFESPGLFNRLQAPQYWYQTEKSGTHTFLLTEREIQVCRWDMAD